MKPSSHLPEDLDRERASFLACLATVLELGPADMPPLEPDADPSGGAVSRWLGGLGLGLVRVADPQAFSWPGPWIARVQPPEQDARYVVMYGVPSGVVWDPAGEGDVAEPWLSDGFLIAAGDIAMARPVLPEAPTEPGRLERIWVSPAAGEPGLDLDAVRVLPGRGLEGDRHVDGRGTFPSGLSGSALTLIEAEVVESFAPPLQPDQHRRNLLTRGIDLNRLVGHEFTIGDMHFRGVRLCEPCTVVQGYAGRPVLRALVHRGGLRADILEEGTIRAGDAIGVP